MLYNYRIKNKKNFYECDIKIIKKAFKKCDESIKCMNQTGGDNLLNYEIEKLKEEEKLKILLNKYNKILYN